MKTLVVYYSRNGSNRYLARETARALQADMEELRPRVNLFLFLLVFSLSGAGPGIRRLKKDLKNYDQIILIGPIWMGQLVSPLRDFLKKYRKDIVRLTFATACAGGDEEKDNKFGYTGVFRKVEDLAENRLIFCEAFPVPLVLPEDQRKDSTAVMNTRLSEGNFTGVIQERFGAFVKKISG